MSQYGGVLMKTIKLLGINSLNSLSISFFDEKRQRLRTGKSEMGWRIHKIRKLIRWWRYSDCSKNFRPTSAKISDRNNPKNFIGSTELHENLKKMQPQWLKLLKWLHQHQNSIRRTYTVLTLPTITHYVRRIINSRLFRSVFLDFLQNFFST